MPDNEKLCTFGKCYLLLNSHKAENSKFCADHTKLFNVTKNKPFREMMLAQAKQNAALMAKV